MDHVYKITGEVEQFPQNAGWYYVRVPVTITEELEHLADRGLVAVRTTVGDTSWDTSLLPMGDATKFIALNARVRSSNHLQLGDLVTVSFSLRTR